MTTEMCDRTLRGAIVGYGFIARQEHLPAYRECGSRGTKVEIVAVADVCEARRRKAKEVLPEATVYDDYRTMFDVHTRRLDFVDIAVPPARHAQIAGAALERGLHVLCEEPLATGRTRFASRSTGWAVTRWPCQLARTPSTVSMLRTR